MIPYKVNPHTSDSSVNAIFPISLSDNESDNDMNVKPDKTYQSILSYHPDRVKFRANGSILIKPPSKFFEDANIIWKTSCIGLFDGIDHMTFTDAKRAAMKELGCVGLVDVFQHPLGYLIFRFESAKHKRRAIDREPDHKPVVVEGYNLLFKSWIEHFHTNNQSNFNKIWVQLSGIPFTYWSINGLCHLASSLGKPMALDNNTLVAAENNDPISKATICVEMDILCSRPNFIMASLSEDSDKFWAKIKVDYLTNTQGCFMCLSLDHVTASCPDLLEIIYSHSSKFISFPISVSDCDSDYDMNVKPNKTYQSILPYHPDSVKFGANGSILIKPPSIFFQNVNVIWKTSCIGFFDGIDIMTVKDARRAAMDELGNVGLVDIFQHPLGYLIFRFDCVEHMLRAIDCSPVIVEGYNLRFKSWVEHFHANNQLVHSGIWVELSRIPFNYWSINGLCHLASSLGKPTALNNKTLVAAQKNDPIFKATICVEMDPSSSWPNFIMAHLPGHSHKFLAKIKVRYVGNSGSAIRVISDTTDAEGQMPVGKCVDADLQDIRSLDHYLPGHSHEFLAKIKESNPRYQSNPISMKARRLGPGRICIDLSSYMAISSNNYAKKELKAECNNSSHSSKSKRTEETSHVQPKEGRYLRSTVKKARKKFSVDADLQGITSENNAQKKLKADCNNSSGSSKSKKIKETSHVQPKGGGYLLRSSR